jgi:hypothetical protein
MGFGMFEALWRTITGTVVWSTVVDFGNEGKIFVRLKRKDSLLYAVMVFKLSAGASYHPMELGDLRNLERAVLATKTQLEAARLDALARKKDAEMMRLSILEKVWQWVVDAPLWREDVVFTGGTKISFRIRRKVDKHSEVVFRSGEEIFRLQVRLRELEARKRFACDQGGVRKLKKFILTHTPQAGEGENTLTFRHFSDSPLPDSAL